MGGKVSLNKKRAEAAGNSNLWSPIEMLEDASEQIRSGEHNPNRAIVVMIDERDGKMNVSWMASRCSWQDLLVVLNLMMKRVLDAWTSS